MSDSAAQRAVAAFDTYMNRQQAGEWEAENDWTEVKASIEALRKTTEPGEGAAYRARAEDSAPKGAYLARFWDHGVAKIVGTGRDGFGGGICVDVVTPEGDCVQLVVTGHNDVLVRGWMRADLHENGGDNTQFFDVHATIPATRPVKS